MSNPVPYDRFTASHSDHLGRGISFLAGIQRREGCVVGEVAWCPVITAQYVFTAHLTGQQILEERRQKFLRYFRYWQTEEGGWGIHAESPPYVYMTTMMYVSLRLLGLPPGDPSVQRARAWLHANGGVGHNPTWGKLWLSMMNLYDYSGVNPVQPEAWLLPYFFPMHPRRMYAPTRLIYLAFSYLYAVRFQTPVSEIIQQLRGELYETPYESINFKAFRNALAPTDVYVPHSTALKLLNGIACCYEQVHIRALREKACRGALERIVEDQRQSNFSALSPVNCMLNTLALFHAKHPEWQRAFKGVDYWKWEDETEGERLHGAHSHSWDTALAVQAICEGPAAERFRPFLSGMSRYLQRAQMRENLPERLHKERGRLRGGFCFSDEHHRWPVSDCTAEALSAITHLHGWVEAQDRVEPEMIVEGVRFVISRQNADGGWGSYECARGGLLFEKLNPAEMFGSCMVEHSYIECTGSCMAGMRHVLDHFEDLMPAALRRKAADVIRKGAAFLRRKQHPDGPWAGSWGIHYIYGSLFAIIGLLADGVSEDDPAILRACQWILNARLPDGGWGESWRSCVEQRPIFHEKSQVLMTSWAVLALLKTRYDAPGVKEAVAGGIKLLRERQLPNGDWPKESVGGVFFDTAMVHYCLYKNYFPIWALGLWESRNRQLLLAPRSVTNASKM